MGIIQSTPEKIRVKGGLATGIKIAPGGDCQAFMNGGMAEVTGGPGWVPLRKAAHERGFPMPGQDQWPGQLWRVPWCGWIYFFPDNNRRTPGYRHQ